MAHQEQVKANALALLAANDGNVLATAKQLGLPRGTVQNWAKGRVPLNDDVIQKSEKAKRELADQFEELARASVQKGLMIARRQKDSQTSLSMAATAAGIATDKMLLLRGEGPTASEAEISEAQRIRACAEAVVEMAKLAGRRVTIEAVEQRIRQIQVEHARFFASEESLIVRR